MNIEEETGFRYFYDKMGFGPAEFKEIPPTALIEKYRGKVPDRMLDYWQAYGFCSFGKGLFWTVNPDEYAPVLNLWLNGLTLPFKDSFYVLGRSALGNLYVWGTRTGQSLTIYPMQGTVFPSDQSDQIADGKGDFLANRFFPNRKPDNLDRKDAQNLPLFKRALKTLGQLSPGEMYGFEPALALGGRADVKNLRRVNAVVHLTLLAQLGERQGMRDIAQDARRAELMR